MKPRILPLVYIPNLAQKLIYKLNLPTEDIDTTAKNCIGRRRKLVLERMGLQLYNIIIQKIPAKSTKSVIEIVGILSEIKRHEQIKINKVSNFTTLLHICGLRWNTILKSVTGTSLGETLVWAGLQFLAGILDSRTSTNM